MHSSQLPCYSVFPTRLGWMAILGCDETLLRSTFGHESRAAAIERLVLGSLPNVKQANWHPTLRERLLDFAEGAPAEFLDIDVDTSGLSSFSRSVIEQCRAIPFGETRSYGQLADEIHSPRAGRAVGNVMRLNRCPIVVPCHRVVHGDGSIGQFSAPQGATMKERLLKMELASRLAMSAS